MPRTPEDIIREMLGAQAIQIAALQAQLEAAKAQIAELEAKKEGA